MPQVHSGCLAPFEAPSRRSAPGPGRRSRRAGPRSPRAAWLVVAVALGLMTAGVLLAEGLLITAGLVLAGVGGHLFDPP